MKDIYIAGIAMTVFGRHPNRSLEDLAGEALNGALKDAGCSVKDLGVAYYAGMTNGPLQGQISIPGQVVFSKIGVESIPVYNVENACASGSSAVNLAVQSLRAGTCDVALALGVEKMNIPDKVKAMSIFEAGWDVSRADENFENLRRMGEGVAIQPLYVNLRRLVSLPYESLGHHSAPNCSGMCKESPALSAQSLLAVSQALYD
jgi:acetyl-CoA acetyltransferase